MHLSITQTIGGSTVVEFTTASVKDSPELERAEHQLYTLVKERRCQRLVLDFTRLQYPSSQTIGIVLALQKKLSVLPNGPRVLCLVGELLTELLRAARLEKALTSEPPQRIAERCAA